MSGRPSASRDRARRRCRARARRTARSRRSRRRRPRAPRAPMPISRIAAAPRRALARRAGLARRQELAFADRSATGSCAARHSSVSVSRVPRYSAPSSRPRRSHSCAAPLSARWMRTPSRFSSIQPAQPRPLAQQRLVCDLDRAGADGEQAAVGEQREHVVRRRRVVASRTPSAGPAGARPRRPRPARRAASATLRATPAARRDRAARRPSSASRATAPRTPPVRS